METTAKPNKPPLIPPREITFCKACYYYCGTPPYECGEAPMNSARLMHFAKSANKQQLATACMYQG
jgi:hypothetical protein